MKKKTIVLTLAALAVLGSGPVASLLPQARAEKNAREKEPKVLEFDTMAGVPRPYTGSANAIRGVPGGGLPWVIGSAKGELTADGRLELRVTGLVFDPSDPVVIDRGLANQNTVNSFAAIVSCLSKDLDGNPVTVNVMTGLFPATTGPVSAGGGNAKIEAHVQLPRPCIAPIVFVTSPSGAWFAATGQ